MGRLHTTLRAVTPLLIHGAKSDGDAELRPPSFRGEWRYWFRAAAGAVIGDRNRDGLVKMESAVFGSTDKGSAVSLKIAQKQVNKPSVKVLPHKEGGGNRSAIAESEELDIDIFSKPVTPAEVWEAAKTSFVLMITLGGVGQRARRGYGTLQVKGSEASSLSSLDEWAKYLDDRISKTLTAMKTLADALEVPVLPAVSTTEASFPCGNQLSRICLVDPAILIEKRSRRPRDQNNSDPGFQKPMTAVTEFMHHVHKQDWLGGIDPRQASPLWVRPIKVGSGYGLILAVLASKFGRSDYKQMDTFLDSFSPRDVRVKGWNQ